MTTRYAHNTAHFEQYRTACQVITGEQIRAARAALGWSALYLAKASQVARRTIVSIEACEGVPSSNAQTLYKIRTALEAAGVEFKIGRAHV